MNFYLNNIRSERNFSAAKIEKVVNRANQKGKHAIDLKQ